MKEWIRWAAGMVCVAVFGACTHGSIPLEEYHVKVYAPVYASGFDIWGAKGRKSTILEVRNPWQGAENVVMRLFIARDGERVPKGFDGAVIRDEARRIVCMSSTQVAMLGATGDAGRIVGVSGLEHISNEYVVGHRDSIGDVGYEGNVNYEVLLSLEPDLVLLYGLSEASGMEARLRELGIPFMYVGEYLEESPLGKAEWLVAVAELAGRRDKGMEVFAGIPARYNALKEKVVAAGVRRPAVMLNTPYGDSWFMPPTDSHMDRLIRAAGGEYIYKGNHTRTSLPVDLEEAYLLVSKADIWLNVGTAASLDEVKALCPKFADTPCFTRGCVYNNDLRTSGTGGNDYWESGTVHPDLVLRDLVKIFHPELVPEEFVYYRQLK